MGLLAEKIVFNRCQVLLLCHPSCLISPKTIQPPLIFINWLTDIVLRPNMLWVFFFLFFTWIRKCELTKNKVFLKSSFCAFLQVHYIEVKAKLILKNTQDINVAEKSWRYSLGSSVCWLKQIKAKCGRLNWLHCSFDCTLHDENNMIIKTTGNLWKFENNSKTA